MLEVAHSEQNDPLIDLTYNRMQDVGILDAIDTPEEVEGANLQIDYISVLAQAQKQLATRGISEVVGMVGSIGEFWPKALHKIDGMQVVDEYAAATGVPPGIIVSDKDAEASYQAEVQAKQMMAAPPLLEKTAKTAQIAAETIPQEGSVLEEMRGG